MHRRNCLTWAVLIALSWALFIAIGFIIWVLIEQGWMTYGL